MPHQVFGRHLGRTSAERRSLFRNLMTDLFKYDRIQTTEAKAKAIRGEAERLITRAKRGEPSRLVSLASDGDNTTLSQLVGPKNAEKLTTLARDGSTEELEKSAAAMALHARRTILKTIQNKAVVDRLIHEIAPRADRPGGYTRIIRLGPRSGDAAPMVFLELVD